MAALVPLHFQVHILLTPSEDSKPVSMPWFLILLNILEIAACITGFLYWKKIRHSYWRWFPVYLGIIVLTELTGEFFLFVLGDLSSNIAVYRFFGVPLQFLFFFWLFYHYFRNTAVKNWPLYMAVIYLACLGLDLTIIGKMELYFDSFSYTIGNILLLIILLLFFFRFAKSDEILRYKTSMIFWVCIGLMIFYIGSLPFYALRTTLYNQYTDIFYIYWYVQFGMCISMYILFIFSFVWGKLK
jgi:hypothetical protein